MQYTDFHGLSLSALGFGLMRLPTNGDDTKVDLACAAEMADFAMAHGVNYYDTAWGYHGGNSERAVPELLGRYPRESYSLASKFPGYDPTTFARKEAVFEEQLERCGTEYFDFYLFHNVCEKNLDAYLDPKYGVYEYLMAQKAAGRIRHLGFSAHGTTETMERFLDAYGKDMEFCQIQLNWLDWDFQNAKAKVELLNRWNIPVWVMEPLRGGSLVKLPEKHAQTLKNLHPEWSLAEWAFRFLRSIPGVAVTLSGMSTLEQMQENVRIYEAADSLSEEDRAVLLSIAAEMTSHDTVPCTACRYCTSHCPQGLDIPWLLSLYNEHSYSGGGFIAPMALSALPEDKKPTACLGCQSCETVCPQKISISEVMKTFAEKLK